MLLHKKILYSQKKKLQNPLVLFEQHNKKKTWNLHKLLVAESVSKGWLATKTEKPAVIVVQNIQNVTFLVPVMMICIFEVVL